MTQGYRQVGKARVSESRMRWFESSYPCHMKIQHRAGGAFFVYRLQFVLQPSPQGKVGAKRSDEVCMRSYGIPLLRISGFTG